MGWRCLSTAACRPSEIAPKGPGRASWLLFLRGRGQIRVMNRMEADHVSSEIFACALHLRTIVAVSPLFLDSRAYDLAIAILMGG